MRYNQKYRELPSLQTYSKEAEGGLEDYKRPVLVTAAKAMPEEVQERTAALPSHDGGVGERG